MGGFKTNIKRGGQISLEGLFGGESVKGHFLGHQQGHNYKTGHLNHFFLPTRNVELIRYY